MYLVCICSRDLIEIWPHPIPTCRDPLQPMSVDPGPRVHSPPDVADAGGAETREAAGRCTGRWPNIAAGGGHSMRQVSNFLKWNEFRSHWEKWWFMFMIWRNLLILVFLNIEHPFFLSHDHFELNIGNMVHTGSAVSGKSHSMSMWVYVLVGSDGKTIAMKVGQNHSLNSCEKVDKNKLHA